MIRPSSFTYPGIFLPTTRRKFLFVFTVEGELLPHSAYVFGMRRKKALAWACRAVRESGAKGKIRLVGSVRVSTQRGFDRARIPNGGQ